MSSSNTLTLLGWRLEDFNQDQPDIGPPPGEQGPALDFDPVDVTPQQEWADGYMHALRGLTRQQPDEDPKIAFLNALEDLEGRLVASVEDSALQMARILLETMATLEHERWSDLVKDRVQKVAELIRPALMSTVPKIAVRSDDGESIEVSAESCIGHSAGTAKLAEHITLSWHLGKAEVGWRRTLRETASALAPLIVGLNLQTMEIA